MGWMSTTVSMAQSDTVSSDTCNHIVQGVVEDLETKEPLPYVMVKVQGVDKFTTTDHNGKFKIEGLCDEENIIEISCFGYSDSNSVCHDHDHGRMPHFYLTKKVINLEMVVVQASQPKEEGTASIAQSTISKKEIKLDPTQSLASSIAQEQGVTLTSTGSNVQLPVIHGLYGNRVLILNNGLKHGFQNWGLDHAPEIDIASANNLTVIKGASGVRYGPEALGGAIIVEPSPLYFNESLNGNINSGFQSNGKGYNVGGEISEGFENFSYFINGNYTRIGDRHAADYMLTNTGKEEGAASAGARYRYKKLDLSVYYSYVTQDLGLLRASVAESGNAFVEAINSDVPTYIRPFSYTINEPNQLTDHHFGKTELTYWYSDGAKLTFRMGQQLNNRQEYDVRRNADKPIIDLTLRTADYQLDWKHKHWKDLEGLIGVQYFYQDNNNNPGTGVTAFIPNYNTYRYSLFLVESKRIGKSTIELGLRFDSENNNVRGRESNQDLFTDDYTFNNLTASLGYIYELSSSSTFRTNLGTAWRSPNMAELYSFGQHGFKLTYGLLRYDYNDEGALTTANVTKMADSDVRPENGFKWINELVKTIDKSTHTFTLYAHYIKNYIFSRPVGVTGTVRGPMPVFIIDQTDAGFVGLDYSWSRIWTNRIKGTFGFSYLYSTNITDKEPLINQPPMNVNYRLNWDLGSFAGAKANSLILVPSYTFKQYNAPRTVPPEDIIDGTEVIDEDSEIFDFKDAPEGYFLLNVAYRIEWEHFAGSVAVNNVFNKSYRDYLNEMRYFADDLGTNFLINLTYNFN